MAKTPKDQDTAEDIGPDAAPKAKAGKEGTVKLKDLIERVIARSGLPRKEAKQAVEATVTEIGLVLAKGEALNLQGLGNLRVARKATAESPVATLKLRLADGLRAKSMAGQDSGQEDDKDTLAQDSDQG